MLDIYQLQIQAYEGSTKKKNPFKQNILILFYPPPIQFKLIFANLFYFHISLNIKRLILSQILIQTSILFILSNDFSFIDDYAYSLTESENVSIYYNSMSDQQPMNKANIQLQPDLLQQRQKPQQAQSSNQFKENDPEEEEDSSLSNVADPSAKKKKRGIYQNPIRKPFFLFFQTKTQAILFVLIAFLVIVTALIISDNRSQKEEISQIIKILDRNQKNNWGDRDKQNHYGEQFWKNDAKANVSKVFDYQSLKNQSVAVVKKPIVSQIPKTLWYYLGNGNSDRSEWTRKTKARVKKIANQSNYTLVQISANNWGNHISSVTVPQLGKKIEEIKNVMDNNQYSQQAINAAEKYMIALHLLKQNGGVYLDEDMVLTEKLDWVQKLADNEFVNGHKVIFGETGEGYQFAAFHHKRLVTTPKRINQNEYEGAEGEIFLSAAFSAYFMASIKNASILQPLIQNYEKVLKRTRQQIESFLPQISELHICKKQDRCIFQSASYLTLQNYKSEKNQTALHKYKLALINENIGPKKVTSYLGNPAPQKLFAYIATITYDELVYLFGEVHYFLALPTDSSFKDIFQGSLNAKLIVVDSFIFKFVLTEENDDQVIKLKDEPSTEVKWKELPKRIFIYFQKKTFQSGFFMQSWVEHISSICANSGYVWQFLNEDNLKSYIDPDVLDRIQRAVQGNKTLVYKETKTKLIGLAVILRQGGVWAEPYLSFTDNLQWLTNIGKEQYIWNRNGEKPQVLLTFNPSLHLPEWIRDKNTGTKISNKLDYSSLFIAAEANNQLINNWFEQYITNIQTPYTEIEKKMKACGVTDYMTIVSYDQAKLPEDSLKCVLGRKQTQLFSSGKLTTSAEYYNLWSLNGFSNILKGSNYILLPIPHYLPNPLIWKYPLRYLQKTQGRISHFCFISSNSAAIMGQKYSANDSIIEDQFHSLSLGYQIIAKAGSYVRLGDEMILSKNVMDYKKVHKHDHEEISKMKKLLWVYQEKQQSQMTQTSKAIFQNYREVAQKSSFQLRILKKGNYKQWLSAAQDTAGRIQNFNANLDKKLTTDKKNLLEHIDEIKKIYALYSILYEWGGVLLTQEAILHDSLQWIRSIESLDFLNKGGQIKVKVIGFHSTEFSTPKKPYGKGTLIQVPALQPHFLAVGRHSQYILTFLIQYERLILNHEGIVDKLVAPTFPFNKIQANDPYKFAFYLTSHIIMEQKRSQLSFIKNSQNSVNAYGLYSFNSLYYLRRLQIHISSLEKNMAREMLGKISFQELQMKIGPLKYISLLPQSNIVEEYIQEELHGAGNQMSQGSFMDKYMISNSSKALTKSNLREGGVKQVWESLPKQIWVYTGLGLKLSTISIQALYVALSKSCQKSGFTLTEVNDTNIASFIDSSILAKLKTIHKTTHPQVSQLAYSLAILAKQGGMSVSPSVLTTQPLLWINHIGDLPSFATFNRVSDLPKLVVFVEDVYAFNSEWEYNIELNTKIGHKLSWLGDVVAGEANGELVKEWLETLLGLITVDESVQKQGLKTCLITPWSVSDKSKLGSDALACVLEKKSEVFKKNGEHNYPADYYGLWGISSSIGLTKFDTLVNFDNDKSILNPLLCKWSRKNIEALEGSVRPLIRLGQNELMNLQVSIINGQYNECNDSSIFRTSLFDPIERNLVVKNNKVEVKLD